MTLERHMRERDDGSLTAGFDLLGDDCVSGRHGASYSALVSPVLTRASQVVLVVRNPSANAGDLRDVGLIPGLGRSPGVGNGNPLQNFRLENPRTEEPGRLQSMGSKRIQHN